MNNTDFRIGILSFNHPEITERAIQSCLDAVPSAPITLLHNGSEPRWIERLQKNFPAIDHVILSENGGFTGGANALIERVISQSEWCLFLTNDVQLLKAQIPDRIGLVAPLIHRRKKGLIDSMGALFFPHSGHLEHCRSHERFIYLPQKALRYVPGTAFWIHREVYQKVGGFDVSLDTYWEDVDYSQKIQQQEQALYYCEKTELLHSVGKTCHKIKKYTAYLFVRNKYYVSLRYLKKPFDRGLFRFWFWMRWLTETLNVAFRGNKEVLAIKLQIAKDLLLK
ncbi:MAG: hypothetical protein RJB66_244 [Pseudomonadota bacterium]|jgi:GT2 family glycosyltransferase